MSTDSKIFKEVRAYIILTFGCLIYALAWTQIFVPNGLVSGGITGLCTVIQYGTGFPMGISYAIFNAVLLILGFLVLGRSFGVRTIYSLAIITLFLEILPGFHLPELYLKDMILIPIIASFMEAIGISMLIICGGSSGGTDIIALIINKFHPVSLGRVYMVLDIAIIASVMLVPGKTVNDLVYGYMAVVAFSLSLDYITLGRKSSVQMFVISDQYAKIADYINNQLERGVTALSSVGWYSQKEKKVLLIYVRRRELGELTENIKAIDPKAFVTVAPVSNVFGEGFEQIKPGFKFGKKKKSANGTV